MYGWRCRIGLITPPDNLLIEPELASIVPEGVSLHSTRLGSIDLDEMPVEAESDAELYGSMGVDVVVYACNISSFHDGPGSDEALCARLRDASGLPATTASTAMLRALDAVDAERVAVVSPYNDAENDLLRAFLEGNGRSVSELSGLGLSATDVDDVRAVAAQTATDTYRRVREVDADGADACLIAATNLASVAAIPAMEADLGMPVVSANGALLWHALRLCGVSTRIDGAGRLFAAD